MNQAQNLLDPPFYCDAVMAKLYDCLMRELDPNAEHISWIAQAFEGQTPKIIVDIGAGTGRVLKEVSALTVEAELWAVEPFLPFREQIAEAKIAPQPRIAESLKECPGLQADFLYCTYGSLQYVDSLQTFIQNIHDIRSVLNPSGATVALELYADEAYRQIKSPVVTEISLNGKVWKLEFQVSYQTEDLIEAQTTISNGSEYGCMHERVLVLNEQQIYKVFEEEGFQEVKVEPNGAYHRLEARVS